jgi:branched-chain amino acid transport system ATP-binding protein
MMLTVASLNVEIESSRILRDVSLEVNECEVVCLIGRNGAGKTTTLRSIMGLQRVRSGRILFQGQDITGWPTHKIARLGIGFSPENSSVFSNLTVDENVRFPIWTLHNGHSAGERVAMAYSIFPTLRGYRARKGAQLSGGERKMLSIARALTLGPRLLLLDEPFEGLSPTIIPAVRAGIEKIVKTGCSVLLAESNIHHVPRFTNRLYVIERGEIIFSGSLEEIKVHPTVARIIWGSA